MHMYIYILLSYISLAYHVHICTTRSPPDNPLMGMDHGLLVGTHHQSWHGGFTALGCHGVNSTSISWEKKVTTMVYL